DSPPRVFECAAKAVQNAADACRLPMFFEHVHAIRPRVAAMDDDGKFCLLSQRHLLTKNFVLRFAWRMVVEIVESNFAPANHFAMLRQLRQFFQMLWRDFLRFVRMDSNRGVNPIVLFSEW